MEEIIKEGEVREIVEATLADFDGGKNIDAVNIDNKPDKSEVRELLDNLFRLVFPGYFRERSFKYYNPRNSFAVTVEDTFYRLNEQVTLALDFCRLRGVMTEEDRKKESYRVCKEFFKALPRIRSYVETDLLAAFDGDPAAGCLEEIVLAYPGLRAIVAYRLAHELYLLKVPVIPRLMTEYAHAETGVDVHPGASIGRYFFIDHGTGIVIGETTIIGDHVKIYQGVTLGALSTRGGQKLSGKKRHPTIGDNVVIYAGASILGGNVVVGEGSVIGGNAFITSSVPARTKVSVRSPEMEYRTNDNRLKTEELKPGDEWFYMI
ncbi:MAG: serine acetyltransferase [Thermoguttaceae bacterium]|nr:serine acetyltransferase [Thermoguttaceae bacterium]